MQQDNKITKRKPGERGPDKKQRSGERYRYRWIKFRYEKCKKELEWHQIYRRIVKQRAVFKAFDNPTARDIDLLTDFYIYTSEKIPMKPKSYYILSELKRLREVEKQKWIIAQTSVETKLDLRI